MREREGVLREGGECITFCDRANTLVSVYDGCDADVDAKRGREDTNG